MYNDDELHPMCLAGDSVATTPSVTTAAELLSLSSDGNRRELVNGEVVTMSPAGGRHGMLAMRLGSLLEQHVSENKLGVTFAAETGFLISTNPDTVRAPDVAFLTSAKWAAIEDETGYLPVAPDLVAEVVSRNDSSSAVEGKVQMWLEAGVQLVLVVDPVVKTIRVYRDTSRIEVLHLDDTLDAGDVVAGWKLKVNQIFS